MTPSGLALALLLAVAALSGLLAAMPSLTGQPATARPALAILSGLGALACLLTITTADAAAIALPIGLPGLRFALVLDPFAALMLLPVLFGVALAAAVSRRGDLSLLGALAMLATLLDLAADAPGLVLGATGVGLVLARLAAPSHRLRSRVAMLCGGCLTGALALLGGPAGVLPLGFAAVRAGGMDPASLRGSSAGLLALLAATALAGLPPFHAGLLAARPPPSSLAGLLRPALMPVLGTAVLLRLLIDLPGAPPLWWCVPPLGLGAAAAVLGGVRASLAERLDRVLGGLALHAGGIVLASAGLLLLARASDLPLLAALALAGLLLSLLAASLGLLLVALAIEVIGVEAGSLRLDRLGGLIQRMPVTAWCLLIGLASLGGLPFTAGFAGLWLVLQVAIAGMRASGPGLGLMIASTVAGLGGAVGLGAFAGARLFAGACLGRPRTPRGAAANEASPPMRLALLLLAGLVAGLGLVPGLGVWLLRPALRTLLPDGRGAAPSPDGSFALDVVGVAPLLLLAVVLGIAALLAWLLRARCPAPLASESWDGGFARPPPWLPFGDPALQAGASSIAAPLAALLPAWLTRRAPIRRRPRIAPLAGWIAGLPRRRDGLWVRIGLALPALLLLAALALIWIGAGAGGGG